jgi:uncharacterized membrane protein YfcA
VLIFTLAGFYAGMRAQDRVNQATFNRGLLLLLSVVGVTLLLRALTQAS